MAIRLSIVSLLLVIGYTGLLYGATREKNELPKNTSQANKLEFFSERSRLFPAAMADPREAQFRVGFLYRGDDNHFLDTGLGGDLNVLRLPLGDNVEFAISARALFTARFEYFSESFNQHNTDFISGPAFAYRNNREDWELWIYHQSSHLGDDLLQLGIRSAQNISFEAMRFRYSLRVTPLFRLYLGPEWIFRADPNELNNQFMVQAGMEWRPFKHLQPLLFGLDLKSKQINDWALDMSAVIAYELGSDSNSRKQRLFVEVFNGASNLGQFFREKEFYVFLGMGFTY